MELRSNLTQSDSEPALAAQCRFSHPFLQGAPRTLLAHLTHTPLRFLTTPPSLPAGCLAPSHHLSCRTYMLLRVSPSGHWGSEPPHPGGSAPWFTHGCWALCPAISGSNRREQKVSRGSGAGESPRWHFSFPQRPASHSCYCLTTAQQLPGSESTNCWWSLRLSGLPFLFHNLLI